MHVTFILVPLTLAYCYLIFRLSKYVRSQYFTQLKKEPIANISQKRLTNFVKRTLDLMLVIFSVIIVIWPLVIVIMAMSQSSNPNWGFDISAYSAFSLDLNRLSGAEISGLRNLEIHGKTMIMFDTSSLYAWYLFASSQLISAMVGFFVVVQIREIVISLKNGLPLLLENALRIKRIGIVILAWNFIMPLIQYFAWGSFINTINTHSEVIQFYPAFEINILGLIVGLLLILLFGILSEASEMSKEQELTI